MPALVGDAISTVVVKSDSDTWGVASRFTSRLSGPSSSYMVVTTVLKLLGREEKIENDGSAEIGVCVVDLVVGTTVWRSDGNGPVPIGFAPVQYDIVVVISGEGKTKLNSVSPYEITFVVRPCTLTDDVEPVGTADIGDVVIKGEDEKRAVVSVCIVMEPVAELADSVEIAVFDTEDEKAGGVDVVLPEVAAEVTPDEMSKGGEDDDEELVDRLLNEDVVFMGGTRLLNMLGEVAPGTPPVVVLVKILLEDEDDEIEVLLDVVLNEFVDDELGKTDDPRVPVELGVIALDDDEDADDNTGVDGPALELEVTMLELLELNEVIDGVPALLIPELCNVEDEGQANMLELGAEEVNVLLVDEAGTLELDALGVNGGETDVDTDVVGSRVKVVVMSDVTRVAVLVVIKGALVVAVLPDAEGLGNEIVKLLPGVELMLGERVTELLGGDIGEDGALVLVVEGKVIGVVCTLEKMLVLIVGMLELIIVKVLGLVAVDTTMLERLAGGEMTTIVLEVTTVVEVEPFGIVLMSVVMTAEVIGEATLLVARGGVPSIVVSVTLVRIVVCPPVAMLVMVIVTLEIAREGGKESVLEGRTDTEDVAILSDVVYCEVVLGTVEKLSDVPDDGATDTDEIIGVISGVFVMRVLNWLGGVMLFIHSVVPFTTEK